MPTLGIQARTTTTLTGGGRSVFGNAIVGFCASALTSALISTPLALAGFPYVAIAGAFVPFVAYAVVLFRLLAHAEKNPDATVTSEEVYAKLQEARIMGAKNALIVKDTPPVLGAPISLVQQLGAMKAEVEDE